MCPQPRATLPTDSWQWGDLVPSQVSTKAQGVRSSIRDAKEGAQAAASSAMKSATSAFSGSIEQLSILADQVRRSKLVDEAKLAALLPASLVRLENHDRTPMYSMVLTSRLSVSLKGVGCLGKRNG